MLQRKPTRIELKAEDKEEVIARLDCCCSSNVPAASLCDVLVGAVQLEAVKREREAAAQQSGKPPLSALDAVVRRCATRHRSLLAWMRSRNVRAPYRPRCRWRRSRSRQRRRG